MEGESFFDNLDPSAYIESLSVYFQDCVTYTSGQDGKMCYGIDLNLDSLNVMETEFDCFGSFNGENCTSCKIQFSAGSILNETFGDDTCIVADCTNIQAGASIDSCQGEGMVGPFQFLENSVDEVAFTLGRCGSENLGNTTSGTGGDGTGGD